MADVKFAAGLSGEAHVALDLAPLALGADTPVAVRPGVLAVVYISAAQEAVHLAVGGDYLAQLRRAQHGTAHHGLALHALAVVGEGHAARRELCHVGQLLPALAAGDGGVGQDADARAAAYGGELGIQVFRAVRHGVEIGHGADGGEAAAGGREGAAPNGLLI